VWYVFAYEEKGQWKIFPGPNGGGETEAEDWTWEIIKPNKGGNGRGQEGRGKDWYGD